MKNWGLRFMFFSCSLLLIKYFWQGIWILVKVKCPGIFEFALSQPKLGLLRISIKVTPNSTSGVFVYNPERVYEHSYCWHYQLLPDFMPWDFEIATIATFSHRLSVEELNPHCLYNHPNHTPMLMNT